MSTMNTFAITFSNGITFNTEFNANLNDAVKYYLGKYFEISVGGNDEEMSQVIKVEQI
jgi:hypothetical protein